MEGLLIWEIKLKLSTFSLFCPLPWCSVYRDKVLLLRATEQKETRLLQDMRAFTSQFGFVGALNTLCPFVAGVIQPSQDSAPGRNVFLLAGMQRESTVLFGFSSSSLIFQ